MRSIFLVGIGSIFTFMGIVGIIAFSSFPMYLFGGGFQLISILFPLIPVAFGILLIIIGLSPGKPIELTIPAPQPPIVQEVIKVKVRCPYCSGLYDETMDKCPNCGAKR